MIPPHGATIAAPEFGFNFCRTITGYRMGLSAAIRIVSTCRSVGLPHHVLRYRFLPDTTVPFCRYATAIQNSGGTCLGQYHYRLPPSAVGRFTTEINYRFLPNGGGLPAAITRDFLGTTTTPPRFYRFHRWEIPLPGAWGGVPHRGCLVGLGSTCHSTGLTALPGYCYHRLVISR